MRRAVRTVLWLIASGIIILSGMYAGLEYVRHRMQGTDVSLWRVCIGTLGVVAGLVLFATSSSLARRLTDDFEE